MKVPVNAQDPEEDALGEAALPGLVLVWKFYLMGKMDRLDKTGFTVRPVDQQRVRDQRAAS